MGGINMDSSFYQFLMAQRGPDESDASTAFANHASYDLQFPRYSNDYHELSHYLEMESDYLSSMDIFDHIWEHYQSRNY